MTYSAVIESEEQERYRATLLRWPHLSAEGATKEEAVEGLRKVVRDRLARAEIVHIEVDLPEPANPWLQSAGMSQSDPMFDQLVADMEAYRRELDVDDDAA